MSKRALVFYYMPKVCKCKIPYLLQPVVAQIGNLHYRISKGIDSFFQELLLSVDSCTKDSDNILKEVRNFALIDDDSSVMTEATVVMHPNIDSNEALF